MTAGAARSPLDILLVSDICVDPRRSSSLVHVAQVLEGLLRAGHRVRHVYINEECGRSSPFTERMVAEYGAAFENLGARLPPAEVEYDVLWLTNLWSANALQSALNILEAVENEARGWKRGPPRTVFDALDWLGKGRGPLLGADERERLQKLEAELRRRCALSLAISEHECRLIREAFALPAERVQLLSQYFTAHISGLARGFGEREHLCFVGAAHEKNTEALKYFLDQLWPRLMPLLPGVEFHVLGLIGAGLQLRLPASMAGRVRLLGFVPELEEKLAGYRLQVVPLLQGSGIKGKLLQSLACGTPVVSTAVGIEGIAGLQAGRDVTVADEPAHFIAETVALYQDAARWRAQQQAGAALVAAQYSEAVFTAQLARVLERLS